MHAAGLAAPARRSKVRRAYGALVAPGNSSESDALACFYRSRLHHPFGRGEVELLARLLPHLRRAVRINDRFRLFEAERDASRVADETGSLGWIHLDTEGHFVRANGAAERVLAAKDRLVIRNRRLHTVCRDDDAALDRAISAALGKDTANPDALVMLRRLPAGVATLLHVAPIPREVERPLLSQRDDDAEVLVLIATSDAPSRWSVPEAAHALRLTPAEAELALALARGDDLEAHAAQRGITIETARWRMKRILEKTGSRRQSDVVRLVLTTIGRLAGRDAANGSQSPGA